MNPAAQLSIQRHGDAHHLPNYVDFPWKFEYGGRLAGRRMRLNHQFSRR
jgi:hypothetical protein